MGLTPKIPPAPPSPAPPPMPLDAAVLEARRRQLAKARGRSGYRSTILTTPRGTQGSPNLGFASMLGRTGISGTTP